MEAFSAAMAEQIKKEGYSLLLFSCQKKPRWERNHLLNLIATGKLQFREQSLSSERMMVLGCSCQPGSELWHFRGGRSDWPWFSATPTQLPCWSSGMMAERCAIHKQHAGKKIFSGIICSLQFNTKPVRAQRQSVAVQKHCAQQPLVCIYENNTVWFQGEPIEVHKWFKSPFSSCNNAFSTFSDPSPCFNTEACASLSFGL